MPLQLSLEDIHERPEKLLSAPPLLPVAVTCVRLHVRVTLRMPSVVVAGTMSTTDVWFAATDATDAFCWIEYLSRFP